MSSATSKVPYSFGVSPITTHAWNGDAGQIALSRNNKEVEIFKKEGAKWAPLSKLDQHDLRVTSIDWAKKTNRIVTCSADRNAYVWTLQDDGKWKHTLVLLRINRAATCVRWSPCENKFAVGSGARLISICYFEAENDWWVSKHIKKPIKSTVTTLDWHPNNCLLAAGTTGFKVRVFSAYIKDIEEKPSGTPWGSKMPFQHLMAEFSNSLNGGGWVHSVSFSSDGNRLAWVGHDSSLSVADATKGLAIYKLKTGYLPLLSCIWVSPNSIVAAGHDCTPLVFSVNAAGQVAFQSRLEEDKKADEGQAKFSAKALFQTKDRTGQNEVDNTVLNTTHQNQISCINIMVGDKERADRVSTTAGDGKLVIWDLRSLEKQLKGLKF
jgi:actin related protein 2/3 complex subunit 1A/1B